MATSKIDYSAIHGLSADKIGSGIAKEIEEENLDYIGKVAGIVRWPAESDKLYRERILSVLKRKERKRASGTSTIEDSYLELSHEDRLKVLDADRAEGRELERIAAGFGIRREDHLTSKIIETDVELRERVVKAVRKNDRWLSVDDGSTPKVCHRFSIMGRNEDAPLSGHNTVILMDGKEMKGVTSLNFSVSTDGLAKISLEMIGKVDVEAYLPEKQIDIWDEFSKT